MSTAADNRPSSFGSATGSNVMAEVLKQNWWVIAIRGVLAVLFGLIALLFPGPTILSLVLVFSAYMLVDGVFSIVAAVRAMSSGERWGILLLQGLASLLTGVLAFLWPAITVLAFVLLNAAWAIVSGGLLLGAAFRINQRHGRWWLVLGGIASLIYGFLLAIAPMIGAIVLTWWIGAYALVLGVTLLVLAFKLRARKEDRRPPATAQAAT
ncbi:MAG TPA: HdeD family acid-resistance protein [Xanthobacteraceae bacterium]|jgi:uncharacterized membrane protein HdeD (DUF308 family)